jgi:hypothetical protein
MVGPNERYDSKVITEESNSNSSNILLRAKHINHQNKFHINNISPDQSICLSPTYEEGTLSHDIEEKAF